MQNNMQNMYIPRCWYKTIVKTNSKYLYLTSDLPAAGRLGVEVKILHNITKYVEYAKYDSTLQTSVTQSGSVLQLKHAKYYRFCTVFCMCV